MKTIITTRVRVIRYYVNLVDDLHLPYFILPHRWKRIKHHQSSSKTPSTKRIILLFKNMHPISQYSKFHLTLSSMNFYIGTLEVHRRNLFRVYNLFLYDNEIIYAKKILRNVTFSRER